MKNTFKFITFIIITLALTSCGAGDFEQVDYYKNDQKTRIFLIRTDITDSLELKEHGDNLMNTAGAITQAYYYHSKEDIFFISARTDLGQIYEVLNSSNYFAIYNINPAGESRIRLFNKDSE